MRRNILHFAFGDIVSSTFRFALVGAPSNYSARVMSNLYVCVCGKFSAALHRTNRGSLLCFAVIYAVLVSVVALLHRSRLVNIS